MKAFIKLSVDRQGVEVLQRDIILKVANKWNWVAPTCMNVVKLNNCFSLFILSYLFLHIQLFFLFIYLFSFPHFRFGTEIMNSCIIAFLSWTDWRKYRLLYILYCILFTMVLYKKYIHIRNIWNNAFIVHPIFCGNCNVWLNLLNILKWICDLLCMVSV